MDPLVQMERLETKDPKVSKGCLVQWDLLDHVDKLENPAKMAALVKQVQLVLVETLERMVPKAQ